MLRIELPKVGVRIPECRIGKPACLVNQCNYYLPFYTKGFPIVLFKIYPYPTP